MSISLQNDIAFKVSTYCQVNNINSQSININNIHADNCDVTICANQNITSSINSSCTQNVNFANDIKNIIKDSILNHIRPGVTLDIKTTNDIESLTSCIVNSLNKQNIDISNIYVKCASTITYDIYGNKIISPGKLDMCHFDQTIVSNIVSECINNTNASFLSDQPSSMPSNTVPVPVPNTSEPETYNQTLYIAAVIFAIIIGLVFIGLAIWLITLSV